MKQIVQRKDGDDLDLEGGGVLSQGWSCSGYSRYLNSTILFNVDVL